MDRPSCFQATPDSVRRHAELSGPACDGLRLSLIRDQPVNAGVVHLDLPCRPSDITRLVMAVVVYAIQRVFRGWAVANVGQKVHERSAPSLADANPSCAVVFKHAVIRIFATLFHRRPTSIFGCFSSIRLAGGMAVNGRTFDDEFCAQAAARLARPVQQPTSHDVCFTPAVAATAPLAVSAIRRSRQASESTADQVQSWWSAHRGIMPLLEY